ncbi:portal protein, partial [Streptomyces clavifer]|uniref:portal protein n=1 Tax=Streptomyces clavifer TaxID=68188 RepID=UPI003441B0D9
KESVDVISYKQPLTGEIATYDSDQIEDIEDELAEAGFVEVARRSVKRRRVYVSVVDGQNFLEKPRRIPGEHIPLIPVYGKRWFIDDIERVEGHIAKAMDPQRLYNLQVSMLADTAAQDPGQIPIVGMEQIRGLEKHWEARNKKRPAFLPLREVKDKAGNIIAGATPAGYTQPAVMNQALAALLQQSSADIQEVTGGSQAMQQMPSNVAQETVNNLMNRADMASFIYLDNMAKCLKRAGEVWLSMAREVYGSEREVRVVNEDGTDDIALMNAQVVDRQTGRVVALNDLSTGRYDVTVDVGPSYTARRDATVSVLTNVLNSMLPTDPLRPAIQGIIMDNLDGEGLEDFKEFNRKQLLTSGIAKPRNQEEQQIVQQAQMAAHNQTNPEMVLAQAQMVAAEAENKKADNATRETVIKAFTAQQDAQESQANVVYKLSQAQNINKKGVMDAIQLLNDLLKSQQEQIPTSPQSPADSMPS